ncbi:MAG TPA: vitamin K epoxide reductase family protein [Acidimicrobiales bacterium]|jgi:uncharacterized membrane protein
MAPVPRWAMYATFVLSLIGLALSVYLTNAHFNGTQDLVCPDSGFINCAKVTTSAQSYFLGIPVAVLGLCGYVVLCVLTSPWCWRMTSRWIHDLRIAIMVGSMAFVLWLVAAEILIIKNICLYCTGVHIVTFLLFILIVHHYGRRVPASGEAERTRS